MRTCVSGSTFTRYAQIGISEKPNNLKVNGSKKPEGLTENSQN